MADYPVAVTATSPPVTMLASSSHPARSPLWWLERLYPKLVGRREQLAVYDRYYEGDHPLLFASEKFRRAFGGLFEEFADNWCDLVVDAVEERLNVEGFRFGDTSGDDEAWRIWQANQLDAMSQIAHTEALVHGECAVLVGPGPESDRETPVITIEHPSQVIVESAPGRYLLRRAALKAWVDDSGDEMATLYLPDVVYKWQRRRSTPAGMVVEGPDETSVWERRAVRDEPWPLPNGLGRVPVVPLENRPRLLKAGCSEIRRVIPLQNAVNKLVADMMVASEYQAFRQRWLTGHEGPEDPDTKAPIEEFRAAIDRVFIAPESEARWGEFATADLSNFVTGIEMVVQHIASQTRTPPHYFYLRGEFPSGESIKSAETGLVAKARRKMRHFGEAWEEVMRLAFLTTGQDAKAGIVDAETIWGDPESRSESEHVDALVKLKAFGVADQVLQERAGFSPTEIRRNQMLLARETLRAGAFGPPPPRQGPEAAEDEEEAEA